MTIPARDSVYVTDRTHFLLVLETQILKLRANPANRLFVVEGLRELARLTPGCLEASRVVGDLVFHQICCTLQHLWQPAIATLLADADEFDGYRVADRLEGALPLEARDPFSRPATW
ncbi:hypothetical protein N7519_000416 [Penicillium mononematosum]|uniref:uncharacterized protein n=1 Tax=Penicillium mononematosum TaxID=268346 RepID=UPI002546728F|nr:uncharacterized protein N7519_000416 [Penicillium mononematosum]KAJ6190395.1 hypothetical protein N7519_000416 [Penicillium mononematosum]